VEVVEAREAYEGDQGEPVSGGAVRGDRAKAERTEGGGAEGRKWVEGGEEGMGVLQDEFAGGDGEGGAEGLVSVRDFELAGARERRDGLERES
jgi:hypothetical protein